MNLKWESSRRFANRILYDCFRSLFLTQDFNPTSSFSRPFHRCSSECALFSSFILICHHLAKRNIETLTHLHFKHILRVAIRWNKCSCATLPTYFKSHIPIDIYDEFNDARVCNSNLRDFQIPEEVYILLSRTPRPFQRCLEEIFSLSHVSWPSTSKEESCHTMQQCGVCYHTSDRYFRPCTISTTASFHKIVW
jgi:hypothetical protein